MFLNAQSVKERYLAPAIGIAASIPVSACGEELPYHGVVQLEKAKVSPSNRRFSTSRSFRPVIVIRYSSLGAVTVTFSGVSPSFGI